MDVILKLKRGYFCFIVSIQWSSIVLERRSPGVPMDSSLASVAANIS